MQLEQILEFISKYLAKNSIVLSKYQILHQGSTLVLKINDTFVARIIQKDNSSRNNSDWYKREIKVSHYLSNKSAPVIGLYNKLPLVPFEFENYIVSFWEFINISNDDFYYSEIGRVLKKCHVFLNDYNDNNLQKLGIINESIEILKRDNYFSSEIKNLLTNTLEQSLNNLSNFPLQALHGDAHLGNFINTGEKILLSDWEDIFLGPIEWDLASVIWNLKFIQKDNKKVEEILNSYGNYNLQALEHSLIARAAVMTSWYPILYPNPDNDRKEKLSFRIKWLEDIKDSN